MNRQLPSQSPKGADLSSAIQDAMTGQSATPPLSDKDRVQCECGNAEDFQGIGPVFKVATGLVGVPPVMLLVPVKYQCHQCGSMLPAPDQVKTLADLEHEKPAPPPLGTD